MSSNGAYTDDIFPPPTPPAPIEPTTEPIYLWITRWHEFQHYAPEPNRSPAWIKAYTKQLDDDDYRTLTAPQRALLHDLRMVFARAHFKLVIGTRTHHERTTREQRENNDSTTSAQRALTQRIGYRVTSTQLKALNQAGFIQFLSRAELDQALEQLYASRTREEVEREKEQRPLRKARSEEQEQRPQDLQITELLREIP